MLLWKQNLLMPTVNINERPSWKFQAAPDQAPGPAALRGKLVMKTGAWGVRSGVIDMFAKDENKETEVSAASVSSCLGGCFL